MTHKVQGVMVVGTSSDVGKSLVVTAFCRLFANEGIKVVPFKSQNMSNNSYITVDGKEIGRAQGIQAEAAKTEATMWMNPILLKPTSNQQSEVVLFGKREKIISGISYRQSFYEKGIDSVNMALQQLSQDFDVIVMEGAGSPVEINLKDYELVNMKVAEIADVPVILVADIDRGGVFASIIGTLELLTKAERNRVKGIIINKFRGDIDLFKDGVTWIEERTNIPVLGVLPYLEKHMIEGEDSLSLQDRFSLVKDGAVDIAVIKLPYISNYTDLEPFMYEDDVTIRWIENAQQLGSPDAIIIPGTKSTIHDLQFLKKSGLYDLIHKHVEKEKHLVGICGGYQMMCETIIDEAGTDTGSINFSEKGFGFVPAETAFHENKRTIRVNGKIHPKAGLSYELNIQGYEIHLGHTSTHDDPFVILDDGSKDGYYQSSGKMIGTYIHSLFHNDEWRNVWLNSVRKSKNLPEQSVVNLQSQKEQKYDLLANHVKCYLDWEKVKEIVKTRG
ncbi:cobyric acid synthase [Heyndrickxia sp. NPDC080065]|uniref:cobyric acid synthase n=1 Tax=Heyndrickxia sp. NPDC080065 TaxID=3390568 RepID=UPI003CFEFCFB